MFKKNGTYNKICGVCDKEFKTNYPNQRYCSDECRHEGWKIYLNNYIKNKYKEDPNFREKMLNRGKNRRIKNNHNDYNKYMQNWREKNPEKIKNMRERYRKNNKEYYNKYMKKRQRKVRWAILSHYGGNPPKCACCGEDRYEFLSIDHMEGNPDKRTIEERRSGKIRIEEWLVKNNFPEGFRVLCHNCNLAIGFYGFCPHKNPEKSFKGNLV